MVSGHPRQVSLVVIDRTAKLVEPSLRFALSLHTYGRRTLGTPAPFPTRTAHDTPVVRLVQRLLLCRTVRSSMWSLNSSCIRALTPTLHSSRIRAMIPWTWGSFRCTYRQVLCFKNRACSHHECLLTLPLAVNCETTPVRTSIELIARTDVGVRPCSCRAALASFLLRFAMVSWS